VAGLRTVAAVAAIATGTVGVSLSAVPPASAAAGGSSLSAGQVLQAGQDLVSPGGQYTLAMQTDGNLVTYGNGCAIWASNTAGTGGHDYLAMQGDGNLVIYTSAGKPVWASNTAGTGSQNTLDMQADGNLVVYTSAGKAVWASGASGADQLCGPASMSAGKYLHSPSGQYKLNMQGDGNLVVYDNSKPIWASNTAGTGSANYVAMQGDGNLVVYTSSGKAMWASNTAGTGSKNRLVMQDDGNLVIYTSAGKAVWASKTAGSGSGGSGASSGTGGYPWAGATPLDESTDDYGYSTCPANDSGCKKFTYDKGGVVYGESDPWGYYLRNCTSYVAWKITQEFPSVKIGDWGNAENWAAALHKAGYSYDSTPRVGDIAVWGKEVAGGYGHVAYVASVTKGIATFDEYNVAETGAFTDSYTSANHPGGPTKPDWYIHIGTPAG
jgi:surface antigen